MPSGSTRAGAETPSTTVPEDGSLASFTAEEAEEMASVAATIEELKRDAANPSDTLLAELERFRPVRPWRMPVGYKVRMSHKFLATTLKGGQKLTNVVRTYVRDHGLDNSVYGKELLRGGEYVDTLKARIE